MRFAVPAFAEASVREADQALGKRFEVKPDTLPKPKPQEAVSNPPVTIERGDRFKSRRSRYKREEF